MKLKILLVIAVMSSSNLCFAYTDYGYSYGLSSPYSGGFSSSMHIREMENDFARQQALNQPSMTATLNNCVNNSFQRRESSLSSQSSRNPDRDYVQSKPLSLKGIYSYDAYGN